MQLSILTITRAEPHTPPFLRRMADLATVLDAEFVIAADGVEAYQRMLVSDIGCSRLLRVDGRGYLESVHDQAVGATRGAYVFRLDDDEAASPALGAWLQAGRYLDAPHWKFARAHLWTDTALLLTPQLWPDHQTRLSLRQMAGGRSHIHAGSPFGGGTLAPAVIEHHKFRVRDRAARAAIADRYDRIAGGAGRGGMLAFQLPEEAYDEPVTLAPLGDGTVRDWAAEELQEARLCA